MEASAHQCGRFIEEPTEEEPAALRTARINAQLWGNEAKLANIISVGRTRPGPLARPVYQVDSWLFAGTVRRCLRTVTFVLYSVPDTSFQVLNSWPAGPSPLPSSVLCTSYSPTISQRHCTPATTMPRLTHNSPLLYQLTSAPLRRTYSGYGARRTEVRMRARLSV